MKLMITVITCLLLLSVMLLSFFNIFNHQLLAATTKGSKDSGKSKNKLLGGLLTDDFDDDSCLSRYQSSLYRKLSPYKPSGYLISKLRSYEMLHKRCGPGTKAYKKATENLGHDDENYARKFVGECRYIVWIAAYGLGNRILTLTSVFLYALLTDRIMLVDQRKDISDLFCEPFPGTSWSLPLDFPMTDQLDSFNRNYSRCYGTMLKNHALKSTTIIPSYLCLYLIHDYDDYDKMFFCERDQILIRKKQSFTIWLARSYNAYLSRADERLGIQVRVFSKPAGYFQHVMDQILACTQREKLLSEVSV